MFGEKVDPANAVSESAQQQAKNFNRTQQTAGEGSKLKKTTAIWWQFWLIKFQCGWFLLPFSFRKLTKCSISICQIRILCKLSIIPTVKTFFFDIVRIRRNRY